MNHITKLMLLRQSWSQRILYLYYVFYTPRNGMKSQAPPDPYNRDWFLLPFAVMKRDSRPLHHLICYASSNHLSTLTGLYSMTSMSHHKHQRCFSNDSHIVLVVETVSEVSERNLQKT